MQKFISTVLNHQGQPVSGAVVTVTTYPGNVPATIYATDGGASIASVTSNSDGLFSFYAADGHYSLMITGNGIQPITIQDVVLNDPNDDAILGGSILCRPTGGSDDGPYIAAQAAAAALLKAELVFIGGIYNIGPATSFTIDPSKTRWRASGPATLRWTAAPTSGVAVTIVGSETAPYETVRNMMARAMYGISIVGGYSSGAKYSAIGLRFGDGTNQTNSFTVSHGAISGWTTVVDYQNNTWWITLEKMRLMWGSITMPSASGNWGENYVWRDCQLLDGLTANLLHGEWKAFGGSYDNSRITTYNEAHFVASDGHIENPGTVTLAQPFFDAQGESTIQLSGCTLVIGNDGTPILQAPFNSADGNPNGIILENMQYTQGGHAGWFAQVSGAGRVTIRAPQRLALSNANWQVFAENANGQLRNYDFESGDLSGWTTAVSGTSTVAVSTARKRRGTYSVLLTASNSTAGYADATLKQKLLIRAGELLALGYAYSRNYIGATAGGVLTGQVVWLDASNAQISTTTLGYQPGANTVDDGVNFLRSALNAYAPGGTCSAEIQFNVQRPSGTGSALVYIDTVFTNVIG